MFWGCRKETRDIPAIGFENHMRADLVVSTSDLIQHVIPGTIFHSDQGSQYGAEQTREVLLKKGFIRSMSRAGTPTDNGFAERFVGQFKLSVAERRRYQTLGVFLQAAEDWINFYNHIRSEEHTSELQSPDHLVCRLLLEKKKQRLDTALHWRLLLSYQAAQR